MGPVHARRLPSVGGVSETPRSESAPLRVRTRTAPEPPRPPAPPRVVSDRLCPGKMLPPPTEGPFHFRDHSGLERRDAGPCATTANKSAAFPL